MEYRPVKKDSTCPHCNNKDAVELALEDSKVIWCSEGHVSVVESKNHITKLVFDFCEEDTSDT